MNPPSPEPPMFVRANLIAIRDFLRPAVASKAAR